MIILIRITKEEVKKLREMGVSDRTNGISHTFGHHKHYYLCESETNLCLLKTIRK